MTETQTRVALAESTALETIRDLLGRRGASVPEITPDMRLSGDLNLDSLELAELSAALEDALGTDPYTEELLPETFGELIAFYRS